MAAAGRMNVLRARLLEMPPRERFWATVTVMAAAAILGWLVAEWAGVVIGAAFAARVLFGKKSQKPQQPPRDADAERLERDLQLGRDRAFELFRPGEARAAPSVDEPEVDHPDAWYLEKDMEHRRREAARLLQRGERAPDRPPAPARVPARLFPPDPRPLPPATPRAELFRDAPPPPRPIVEEGSRLFRRARRSSGKIVE